MDYRFNFVVDNIVDGKALPALAQWPARPFTEEWRKFGEHWPFTVPSELYEHCNRHRFPYKFYRIDQPYPDNSYYVIGLGFFDFEIDYFGLLPVEVSQAVRSQRLKIMFYYHEADNPYDVKKRLEALRETHQLPEHCYRFVSGNTQADNIPGFVFFPDHELLYWSRGFRERGALIHEEPRSYMFTVLNRTHKWWRATAMADLWREGLLDNAQWSYQPEILCPEIQDDNPIEIDSIPRLRWDLNKFLAQGPHYCDDLTSEQHNDHSQVPLQHYNDSYCSIIMETHYDIGGSGGAFLTEKTFKAIKHGHPFVIVGCPGSLETLRSMGYKTFDHAIDNSYDQEKNNTKRWILAREAIKKIAAQQDIKQWFETCRDDLEHNQRLFAESKHSRLNNLLLKLDQS